MPRKKVGPPAPKRKAQPSLKVEPFTEEQKLKIIEWLAAGLTTREMNVIAATMKPPFILTSSETHYYRLSRQIDVEAARKARESEVMNSGFALRERRVEALNSLSMKIFDELNADKGSKLWLSMVKGIGSGDDYERIEYKEFNKAEIDALRNLLDDIASEVGGRVRRTDITTKDKPITPASSLDPRLWKDLSDDELAILERAAEILERSTDINEDDTA